MNRFRDTAVQNYTRRLTAAIFGFGRTGSRDIGSADPKTLPQNQTRSESHDPLQKYGHTKISKTTAGRHLGFSPTGNSAIRSADIENPTVEPKMKRIGCPVPEIWQFEIFQDGGRPAAILK